MADETLEDLFKSSGALNHGRENCSLGPGCYSAGKEILKIEPMSHLSNGMTMDKVQKEKIRVKEIEYLMSQPGVKRNERHMLLQVEIDR